MTLAHVLCAFWVAYHTMGDMQLVTRSSGSLHAWLQHVRRAGAPPPLWPAVRLRAGADMGPLRGQRKQPPGAGAARRAAVSGPGRAR